MCDRETERPRFEICVGIAGRFGTNIIIHFIRIITRSCTILYTIYLYTHRKRRRFCSRPRSVPRDTSNSNGNSATKGVGRRNGNGNVYVYMSSRKSDVLFRRCCRCRFSDHPALHKSRGIEADNSRATPL